MASSQHHNCQSTPPLTSPTPLRQEVLGVTFTNDRLNSDSVPTSSRSPLKETISRCNPFVIAKEIHAGLQSRHIWMTILSGICPHLPQHVPARNNTFSISIPRGSHKILRNWRYTRPENCVMDLTTSMIKYARMQGLSGNCLVFRDMLGLTFSSS